MPNFKWMVLSRLNELEGMLYIIGVIWKSSFQHNQNCIQIWLVAPVMIKTVLKGQTVLFESSYPNPCVMAFVPPTRPSWTWIRLIKAFSLLFITLLKSTLAYVSRRSSLKVSLNLLALSLVTKPTRASNGSFSVAWITSLTKL